MPSQVRLCFIFPVAVFKGPHDVILDPDHWNDLKVIDFTPKTFQPDDIEPAITHCGVCGSDVHTLTQGWGDSKLPLVVGHEIVGKVTRVGNNVSDIKMGDIVGVGAQRGSCMSCRACKDGYENYCPKGIDTYVRIALMVLTRLNPQPNVRRTPSIPTASSHKADIQLPSAPTSASSFPFRRKSSPATPPR